MTMENRSYIHDFEQNPVIPQLFTSYDKFFIITGAPFGYFVPELPATAISIQ